MMRSHFLIFWLKELRFIVKIKYRIIYLWANTLPTHSRQSSIQITCSRKSIITWYNKSNHLFRNNRSTWLRTIHDHSKKYRNGPTSLRLPPRVLSNIILTSSAEHTTVSSLTLNRAEISSMTLSLKKLLIQLSRLCSTRLTLKKHNRVVLLFGVAISWTKFWELRTFKMSLNFHLEIVTTKGSLFSKKRLLNLKNHLSPWRKLKKV